MQKSSFKILTVLQIWNTNVGWISSLKFNIQRCHYMYKRGHFLLFLPYTHMYWFASPHWVRYNCVDVDEYESLSSAIIPVLPLHSLPRDLFGQLWQFTRYMHLSIDSPCNYWTPARLQGPLGITMERFCSVQCWPFEQNESIIV